MELKHVIPNMEKTFGTLEFAGENKAEQDFRSLLNIPSNYKVLFCHGGGRGQFAGIPLNLLGDKTQSQSLV